MFSKHRPLSQSCLLPPLCQPRKLRVPLLTFKMDLSTSVKHAGNNHVEKPRDFVLSGDFHHTPEDPLFQRECPTCQLCSRLSPGFTGSDPWCFATKTGQIFEVPSNRTIDVVYQIFPMFSVLHPLPHKFFFLSFYYLGPCICYDNNNDHQKTRKNF